MPDLSRLRAHLRLIVQDASTPAGYAFDLAIQAFIVASLIAFAVETLPDLRPEFRQALRTFERVSLGLFTAEYALRLWVARRPKDYAFSFYGIIDLLAILPYYLAPGLDLRSFRAFRLFRFVRALKVFRYSRALRRFRLAFAEIRAEMTLFAAAACVLTFVAASGVHHFERDVQPEAFASVFDAMWWAVATFTTVGYGDVYPVTVGGKLFTTVMLFVALGVFAVPAGLVASALSEVLRDEDELPPNPSERDA